MSEVNFWTELLGSMLRIEDYLNFVKRPTAKAISYLILVTFIISLLSGIQMAVRWNSAIDMIGKEFMAKAPDFVFNDGELTVNAAMPYIMAQRSDELVVVDTSGQSDESVLKDYKKGMFIGRSHLVTKTNPAETKYYDFSAAKGLTFTKADMVDNMPLLKWFNLLIVLFMFIFSVLANLAAALFVGCCGLLAGKIIDCRLDFTTLYKIAVYTLTLPLLVELVIGLSHIPFPLFKIAFYIISVTYMVRVLKLIKTKQAEEILEK